MSSGWFAAKIAQEKDEALRREKMIYDTVSDEELVTPVGELSAGRAAVIAHVLKGPFGDQLMKRIKNDP
jgi:hypothetical protein